MVQIKHPPPDSTVTPQHWTLPVDSKLLRLFDPKRHTAQACKFRYYGPLSRFDHQELVNESAAESTDRGIIYAGISFSGCIVEVFGDTRVIEVGTWEVAQLQTKRDMQFLELRDGGAMRSGTVSAVMMDSDRAISQLWSKFFYENHYLYSKVDGLAYNNAHNSELALAIYERGSDALECIGQCPLRDEALRGAVLKAAAEFGLIVMPY